MIDTKISWAHATWNPWTGCDKVSNECVGCYADALLTRTGRTFNILALTQTWKTPYQLNALAKAQGRQAICFVCSLSDFFHADADRWRRDAWRIIHDCKNVNFMLLTKRPERIAACLPGDWNDGKNYPNAWLGTTCGARSSYARLDVLRSIPCALRFVSVEPLMESVSDIDITGIGWVAVGGMSGALQAKHKTKMVWAAEVHDVCRLHEVPFLFKQASDIHTERGINALSLYLAERAGILSLAEIRAILGNIQPAAIKIMVATAAASALRRSEFRGLKWEDLDLDNLWFHCRRGLVGKSETKMKTRASRKRVEMNPALAEALLEWRSSTPYPQDSDWVFASPYTSGRRPYWPDSALKDHVRPAAIKAGITKAVGWHTFRHSLASLLGQKGEDVKVIQELLRHASSRITSDVYQQGHTDAKRSGLNRIAGIFEVHERDMEAEKE